MRGIDFISVVAFTTIITFAMDLAVLFAFRTQRRRAGFAFTFAAVTIVACSGTMLTLALPDELMPGLNFTAAVLTMTGFSLFFSGVRSTVGSGLSIAWYLGVGAVHAIAVLGLWLTLGNYAGLLTVIFSTGTLLLVIPCLVDNLRHSRIVTGFRSFDLMTALLGFFSLLRLIVGALDPKDEAWLDVGSRTWIYLGLSASAIALGTSFIIAVAAQTFGVMAKEGAKELLSLTERGLTQNEADFVLALLADKSPKEISAEKGLSPSTVRTTLSRCYVKLRIRNHVDLFKLASQYDIVR